VAQVSGALSMVLALWASAARAEIPIEEAQQAELDRVRAEVADEVQLAAYDLIDELVYGWTSEPVFETPTPVVLASVTVPVGLGTGMQALLENHLADVLAHNPTTHVRLVHCPACTAVIVHSGPEGTVVSRGLDNPAVLAEIGGVTGQHALFVDVEAEGSWLVLRARLTQLTPELPIVWSHMLATSTSTPALLRQSELLKSAAEARKEYMDVLRSRGPLIFPLRFAVRTYKQPNLEQGFAPPPFVWLQSGAELGATSARAWTASLMVGYSFVPEAYQGILGQARISRLVTGRSRSLTHPDLYAFVGAAVITVWGPTTASFKKRIPSLDQVIAEAEGDGPRSSFGTLQVGLDLRVGNRIGLSTFLETAPDLADSQNMGDYVRIGSVGFQSLGTEVTFWF
jgi:hypothetical protein